MAPSDRLTEATRDSLEYIQAMLEQLRRMAKAQQADMIAYLIEMAHTETTDVLRGHRPLRMQPSGEVEKRDSAA